MKMKYELTGELNANLEVNPGDIMEYEAYERDQSGERRKYAMEVVDSFDASDVHDKRTIYTVALEDGRTVDVMRKHFAPLGSDKPLVYVMEPHPDDINEQEILSFLRNTHEDFAQYSLVREYTESHSPVREACYSYEQAEYIAKQQLERPHKNLKTMQIYRGKELVKDYLKEKKITKSR